MALTAVCIDRRTGIAQRAYQFDKLVSIMTECIEVVIDEDSVRPAFVRHLERLDNPVVARLAVASQGFAHDVGIGLMSLHGLVDHIYQLKIGVLLLDGIHPLHHRLVLIGSREVLQPFRILRTPYQTVELKRETFLLSVVKSRIGASPIVGVPVALDGAPLSTVLGCHLIPIVGINETIIVHATGPVGGDVTKELVGVGRQLRLHTLRGKQATSDDCNKCFLIHFTIF